MQPVIATAHQSFIPVPDAKSKPQNCQEMHPVHRKFVCLQKKLHSYFLQRITVKLVITKVST